MNILGTVRNASSTAVKVVKDYFNCTGWKLAGRVALVALFALGIFAMALGCYFLGAAALFCGVMGVVCLIGLKPKKAGERVEPPEVRQYAKDDISMREPHKIEKCSRAGDLIRGLKLLPDHEDKVCEEQSDSLVSSPQLPQLQEDSRSVEQHDDDLKVAPGVEKSIQETKDSPKEEIPSINESLDDDDSSEDDLTLLEETKEVVLETLWEIKNLLWG